MRQPVTARWGFPIVLLLILFATRLYNLTALPLHNDEGLHLTRAVEVWNFHPFWDISDGKIINHWFIAAFYPQNAPDFAARIPTVFVAMVGFAAGYALVRRYFGATAALWGAALWIASPYLFFFERLGQSDPEAGAFAVLAVVAALRLARRGTIINAVVTGICIALAVLMKFSAAPFAIVVAGVVFLFGGQTLWQRVRNVVVIGLVGAAMFAAPVVYLALRGESLFNIAFTWIGGAGGDNKYDAWGNFTNFTAQFTDLSYAGALWTVVLPVGWVLLCGYGRSFAVRLVMLALFPFCFIVFVSTETFPRHFVVTLPLLLLLAGAGWGLWLEKMPSLWRRAAYVVLLVFIAVNAVPFMWQAYSDPEMLRASRLLRREYIETHSAGFGLREAMLELPQYTEPGADVIASMFPAGCRRANFYAVPGYMLTCADAPGEVEIDRALAENGAVYVLVERSPLLGIDIASVDASSRLLASYPRRDDVSVVELYYLTRD